MSKEKGKIKKIFGWIKEHVRPDIGLNELRKEEEIDFKSGNISDIADQVKDNVRVGIKFTFKF